MADKEMYNITQTLFGTKELIIKPPIITEKIIKRKWWFNKTEYWIEWEYVCLGPYKSYSEAYYLMKMYG